MMANAYVDSAIATPSAVLPSHSNRGCRASLIIAVSECVRHQPARGNDDDPPGDGHDARHAHSERRLHLVIPVRLRALGSKMEVQDVQACKKQADELYPCEETRKRTVGLRPEKQQPADHRGSKSSDHPPIDIPKDFRNRPVPHNEAQDRKSTRLNSSHS